MRRRIIVAFIAVMAVSLFIAGSISFELVRRAAGDTARDQLLHQVHALQASTHSRALAGIDTSNLAFYTALIPFLQKLTNDKVEPTIEISANGNHVLSVTSLPGVPNGSIAAKDLVSGKAVSGLVGSLVYAIAPLFSFRIGNTTHVVAIALESTVSPRDTNTWYFFLAGGVSLIVAAGLAAIISRRIAGHVVTAATTAQQLASGDLAARMTLTGHEYPELSQLGTSLNTMAENLERSRDLERQFLMSISHDLRTPLTSIRGYSEAIAEGVAGEPEIAAKVIVAESDRLGRLIGDLLDLARIDARQFSLELAPIDVAVVARNATDALRYEFDAAGVTINFEVDAGPHVIDGDFDRLGQVASNLIENALKFANHHVVVRLSGGAAVVLAIEDDGPGISADDFSRVFDRHFTSGRTGSRHAGTGLGLAIVAELVDAMNGKIAVASPLSASGGTRIATTFPPSAHPASTP